MARPKKKIDYDLVKKLAEIQCTQEEISNILDISVRTLQRDKEFCRIYNMSRENGKMSLKRWQFKRAEQGSDRMLIWLGKQYLGQRDVIESNNTHEVEDLSALVDLLK